jgi:hypothetical protein
MAQDLISELNPIDLNEFKKDFTELMRVYSGISNEYSKLGKDVDKYLEEFKKIINLFNKKYKNINFKLKKTVEELQLKIFFKENSVKDVFVNVASKLNGLKAIGTSDFDQAKTEEADKFSKELDNAKNKLFISYFDKELDTVFLEQYKKEIELHYGDEIKNENSPEFKLCAYYAVKEGISKINVYEKLSVMGFVEKPALSKIRNFLKKFNPRIEE